MSLRAHSAASRHWLPLLAVVWEICLFAGCSLFPGDISTKSVSLNRPSLPPIQTSNDAIQLEVFLVDRPADDPLLGPTLWREVDQIAAIPAETREILHQNGFLIGHAGSSPPVAVQSLLGLVTDVSSNDNSDGKPMVGLRKRLPPGIETEVQASNPIDKCQIKIVDGARVKTCDYEQMRCMFRLKSARLRDGWIRIDFQPEIHHGELRARYTPTDEALTSTGFSGQGGWAYQSRQKVDARRAQQFSLTMNVGEIAIITSSPDHPDSMGERFFRREDDGGMKQRLLIVRVADGGQSAGAY